MPFEVLLSIPSGQIVFANDLRRLVCVRDHFDLNSREGGQAFTEAAAAQGLALIFVGNTCPSVYVNRSGLCVGTARRGKQAKGRIPTDLWWYSAMDSTLFAERCARRGLDPEAFGAFRVDVEPGVYAFSDEEVEDRDAVGVVLSRITLTEAAAPALMPAEIPTATRLADSTFWAEVNRVARLVRADRNTALCDILTVLGNGYRWHDGHLLSLSGCPADTPFVRKLRPVEAPRDTSWIPELPGFRAGIRMNPDCLYPMDWDYAKVGKAPKDIDLYWLAGTMMFLKSALAADFHTLGDGQRKTPMERALDQLQAMTPGAAPAPAAQPDTEMSAETRQNREIMTASLDALCRICVRRALISKPDLTRAFTEITEAWNQ